MKKMSFRNEYLKFYSNRRTDNLDLPCISNRFFFFRFRYERKMVHLQAFHRYINHVLFRGDRDAWMSNIDLGEEWSATKKGRDNHKQRKKSLIGSVARNRNIFSCKLGKESVFHSDNILVKIFSSVHYSRDVLRVNS